MAASDRLSSALAPLSVNLDAETSAITSSKLLALEITAPVQVASPIVENELFLFE